MRFAAIACFCLALVTAGCGSDGSEPTTVAPGPTPRAVPVPTATPTPAAVHPVLWVAGCGAPDDPGCGCQRNLRYCEEGVLARSDDLGHTWTKTFFDTGLGSVAFATSEKGWAVGADGVILRTIDGGQTWVPQTDGVTLPAEATARRVNAFNSVRFFSEQRGVIVGFGQTDEFIGTFGPETIYAQEIFVLVTEDGGEVWEPAMIDGSRTTATGLGVFASSICFTRTGVGVVAGNPTLLTQDGGRTWKNIQSRVLDAGWWGAACEGDDTLILAAGSHVVRSNDGGESWKLANDPDVLPPNCCNARLDFLSVDRGWRSGETLNRTDDGGRSWHEVDAAIPPGFGAIGVGFATPNDGLWTGTGVGGVTHDGGASWELVVIVPFDDGLFALPDVAVVE